MLDNSAYPSIILFLTWPEKDSFISFPRVYELGQNLNFTVFYLTPENNKRKMIHKKKDHFKIKKNYIYGKIQRNAPTF